VDRGLPLPLGSVRNARSSLYVRNLTDAMVLAVTSPDLDKEIFLVAQQQTWSTPELLRELARRLGRPSHLLPVPVVALNAVASLIWARQGLAPLLSSSQGDSTRFRSRTGWRQPFSASAGLDDTVAWYRTQVPK